MGGGPIAAPDKGGPYVAGPLPLVSESTSAKATADKRQAPPMTHNSDSADLQLLIRRIIREETGVQEKRWPIDSFFHQVVMLRNRLRTLEQQVNASDLPDDQKVKSQGYITGCYGSLTSFNVRCADEDDKFVGASQNYDQMNLALAAHEGALTSERRAERGGLVPSSRAVSNTSNTARSRGRPAARLPTPSSDRRP